MAFSVTDKIRQQYIDENLESAKKIHYTQTIGKYGVKTVLYKDLTNTEMQGYPFASDYVSPDGKTYSVDQFLTLDEQQKKQCELRYYYIPYSHELYVGTTGSGKTTGCVEPQLRAISAQKNKPNLFITDPKGELFDRNANHLKENGYELFILNFKDHKRSDRWNPLLELYEKQMKQLEIGKGLKFRTGKPDKNLALICDKSQYGEVYVEYEGKAFPSAAIAEDYLRAQKDFLSAEVSSLVNELVNMFIVVSSTKDPSWEYGAQDLLKGIIHCMLTDAVTEGSGFTKDMMTLKTIQEYYMSLRNFVISKNNTLYDHPMLKNKSKETVALMATALNNASNTMKSYCGVFDGAFKDWVQAHIVALTTGNTIDIDNLDKPYAIFIVTRDYEKSDFRVAGLFIDWLYRKAIEKAERIKNPRALHFLLDEFGNIPKIKDLENKIATSRSRNIWFHLVVQSYKQIDLVYGEDTSVIIRDNCNSQIFLGAQNRKTKEIFAEECGKHFIPTLESKLQAGNYGIVEVPLVPVSDLDLITPGCMYVKRLYMPVVTSQFIRSYIAAAHGDFKHFNECNGLETCSKVYYDSFSSPKYCFKLLNEESSSSGDDFDF
ncbi:MAG: type IV secretory system conjugative DNA transfer family protein [Clostridia bacterium]|nr:type IV secretory system conjugative DNA transfer family protein [Clostridia bacterium]